ASAAAVDRARRHLDRDRGRLQLRGCESAKRRPAMATRAFRSARSLQHVDGDRSGARFPWVPTLVRERPVQALVNGARAGSPVRRLLEGTIVLLFAWAVW